MKRSEKQLPSKAKFRTFFDLFNCSHDILKQGEMPLRYQKMSRKLSFKGSGTSWNQKKVSRDNNSQNNI